MVEMGSESRPEKAFTAGVFLVDKPPGVTSFSVVRDVRRLLDIKKVGHAGTLDPFATGLLIICAGRPATRLIERFMTGRKVYQAMLQLGRETDTLDPEGKVTRESAVPELSTETIQTCLAGFVGKQKQVPPQYSAVKYKGKPLYYYARKGIEVTKEPKEIEIFALDLTGYDPGSHRLEVRVECSRGTYVRVLAADIGRKLGCGAYLHMLRRLSSGKFSVAQGMSGEILKEPDAKQTLLTGMIPVDHALAMLENEQEMAKVDGKQVDT